MDYPHYYLQEFKKFVSLQTSSPNTLKNYLSDLRLFFAYITEHERQNLLPQFLPYYISHSFISHYEQYLSQSTPPATTKRRLSSLKKFIDYCATQDIVPITPVSATPPPAPPVSSPPVSAPPFIPNPSGAPPAYYPPPVYHQTITPVISTTPDPVINNPPPTYPNSSPSCPIPGTPPPSSVYYPPAEVHHPVSSLPPQYSRINHPLPEDTTTTTDYSAADDPDQEQNLASLIPDVAPGIGSSQEHHGPAISRYKSSASNPGLSIIIALISFISTLFLTLLIFR